MNLSYENYQTEQFSKNGLTAYTYYFYVYW